MPDDRQLVRRIDWRFLVPNPTGEPYRHLVMLGASAELIDRVRQMNVAHQVGTTLPGDRVVDMIACLQNASVPLEAVARSLSPEGCLYLEWSRTSFTSMMASPAAVEKSLSTIGLTSINTYLVSPNLDDARIYLPVGSPAALAWYVNSLYNAATPKKLLLEWLLRASTGLRGDRFAKLAPQFAVTALGSGASANSVPAPLQHVGSSVYPDWTELRTILLGDTDERTANRVVMLPFTQSGAEPIGVIKVPRLPSFNQRTEHEHATLEQLHGQLSETIRKSLPQPRALVRYGDVSMSVESFVSGESLARRCGRWGAPLRQKIRDLQQAATWLMELHGTSQLSQSVWDAAQQRCWIDGPLEAYAQTFGLTVDEQQFFAAARLHAQRLSGLPFPIVWRHRDFNVWNLFRAGDSINVIDWEGARPGPPLCDLIHLATHWHDTVRNLREDAERRRGVYHLFCESDERDRAVTAVHSTIDEYMERLDLDRRFIPLLLLYTWVELSLRRHEQQRDSGVESPDARVDNQYRAVVALLARHRVRLFAGVHGS